MTYPTRPPATPAYPVPPHHPSHPSIQVVQSSGLPFPIVSHLNRPLPVEQPVWVTALSTIQNVVVIVTCVAVLYTIVRGWLALHQLGEAWQQISQTWGN